MRAASDHASARRGWYGAARAAGERLRRGLLAAYSNAAANAHRAFEDPGSFVIELAIAMGFALAILVFPN